MTDSIIMRPLAIDSEGRLGLLIVKRGVGVDDLDETYERSLPRIDDICARSPVYGG